MKRAYLAGSIKHLFLAVSISLTATFVRSSPASAQTNYTDQVWEQLQRQYEQARDQGYELRNYIVGSLDEDDDDFWTMTFYGGEDYEIWGFCDDDCDDLDLAILTDDGTEIDSDTLADSFPLVNVSPGKDTDYEVKVTMYACSDEPCYFGIGIFEK